MLGKKLAVAGYYLILTPRTKRGLQPNGKACGFKAFCRKAAVSNRTSVSESPFRARNRDLILGEFFLGEEINVVASVISISCGSVNSGEGLTQREC